MPSYDTTYGPIGSISYDDDYVNIQGVPWNELVDRESKDAVQELPKGAAENGSLTKATSTASEDIIRDAGEGVNARFSIDEDYEREDVPDYFRGNPYWLETEHAAKAAGYPEIDGVQIMPYKTWVRSKEQGNYGFVVGLAPLAARPARGAGG